mmetsp:Transcript_14425/g.36951  ORF Transcript_14425/g.36951 Transcript_14425/m.36951 type:complete len:572 (+) Transcript_14425:48-1763(+)
MASTRLVSLLLLTVPLRCSATLFSYMDPVGIDLEDPMSEKIRLATMSEDQVNEAVSQYESQATHHINTFAAGEPDMQLGKSDIENSCRLGGSVVGCPMSGLKPGVSNLIFPGGKTRCIFACDEEYAFRVYPDRTDKLLLFFQGGGACFNEASTVNTMCKWDIAEPPTTGVFDKTNPANPFRDFTIVQVVYCSGDLHIGSVLRDYGDGVETDGMADQRGAPNSLAAISWAKENMAEHLSHFVVAGCSAGSLGTQVWANYLLSKFSYSHGVVLGDSYLSMFPGHMEGKLLKEFGLCDAVFLTPVQQSLCITENLSVRELMENAMTRFPHVTFANLNSKDDGTQQSFHTAVGLTFGVKPSITDGVQYLAQANEMLRHFNMFPNYVSYLVDGEQHCFLPVSNFFVMNPGGTEADCEGVFKGPECVSAWLWSLVETDKNPVVDSKCHGEKLHMSQWHKGGLTYCDAAQVPKYFNRKAAPRLAVPSLAGAPVALLTATPAAAAVNGTLVPMLTKWSADLYVLPRVLHRRAVQALSGTGVVLAAAISCTAVFAVAAGVRRRRARAVDGAQLLPMGEEA